MIIMLFLLLNATNQLSSGYKDHMITEMVDLKIDFFYVNSYIEDLETSMDMDMRKLLVHNCIFGLEYLNSDKFKESLSLILNTEIEDDDIQSLNNAYKFFKENKDELTNNGDIFQSKEFSEIEKSLYNLEVDFSNMTRYLERSNNHVVILSRLFKTLEFDRITEEIMRDL